MSVTFVHPAKPKTVGRNEMPFGTGSPVALINTVFNGVAVPHKNGNLGSKTRSKFERHMSPRISEM